MICGPYAAQVTSHSRGSRHLQRGQKGHQTPPQQAWASAVHSPFPLWLRVQWDLVAGVSACDTYLLEGSLGCLLAGGGKKMGEIVKRGGHERKSREPHPPRTKNPTEALQPQISLLIPSCLLFGTDLGELVRRLHAGYDGAHFCNFSACKC